MRFFALILFATGLANCAVDAGIPLAGALRRAELKCALSGNGRNQLALVAQNPGAAAIAIECPAGLVCTGASGGGKVIVLRAVTLDVPPGGSAEARIPSVALSVKNAVAEQAFAPVDEPAPVLDPLIRLAAARADLPNATAQLLALVLTENISFAAWQTFLAPARVPAPDDPPPPLPAEIATAVDSLALLREVAPGREFALAVDGELKLRALRSPWSRAKAIALYGLDTGEGAIPPDLGQLLHTKPNDNCPICRQRARMQQGPDF